MAIWKAEVNICGEDVEFTIQMPDSFTEQDVYDFIYADMWLDLTKED